jgi:aldehyde dehydrogenase (NAD+)
MISQTVFRARAFYDSGKTLPYAFRVEQLRRLRQWIEDHQAEINHALYLDLNKSEFESYMAEIGMLLSDITFMIKHLKSYMKDRSVKTASALFPGKCFISPHPYGVCLIMSPWNYPFMLAIDPLIGAIAAGNTAILKPSAYAPNTSRLIDKLVKETFEPDYIQVILGGREENNQLLEERFDHIFFTGSVAVGKEVMEKASKHLTPVILELGGKSPCIVSKTTDLKLAAKRIAFGKLLNAGQTCVAPDYVYIDQSVKDEFVQYLSEAFQKMVPQGAAEKDFPKIINEKHFNRVMGLIKNESVILGGTAQDGKIAPTILDAVTFDSPVMQGEIFGPVMPVIPYNTESEMIAKLKSLPHPLALYLFGNDPKLEKQVLDNVNFGGGCINGTIMHLATPYMPFGGVGNSGMGGYHGEASFKAFSHERSILKKGTWIDFAFQYPPYTKMGLKMLKMFLK